MPFSSSPEAFAQIPFDFIIVGGGNVGLPIAARLSENANFSVGVIEAGASVKDDPLIFTPGLMGLAQGQPAYDWGFATTPQTHVADRVVHAPRGKLLGGSTGLNYMAWQRASAAEYDAWDRMLAAPGGWDARSMFGYLRKLEQMDAKTSDAFVAQASDPVSTGIPHAEQCAPEAPVKSSYNNFAVDIAEPFSKAVNSLGVKTNANPGGGYNEGVYNLRRSVDSDTGKRITAAYAYLDGAIDRPNLHVLTGAHATQVLFGDKDASGNCVARGVRFHAGGATHDVAVAKEVILSAGVVQSPQLLELSGIGNPEILKKFGIETLVDLPNVGENLLDHVFTPVQYITKPGVTTWDELRNKPEFLAEQQGLYMQSGSGWLANIDSAAAFTTVRALAGTDDSAFAALLDAATAPPDASPLRARQLAIQREWLEKRDVANVETLAFSRGFVAPEQGKSYFVLLSGIQHPFSRGSIHIGSANPLEAPLIDPKYLSHPFDMRVLQAAYGWLARLAATEELSALIEAPSFPPIPLDQEQAVQGYICQTLASGSHLMGTCIMADRALGGVVGADLKVYGTANVRVADTSIIPLSITGHIQATAYAIGEKAADLIKKDW